METETQGVRLIASYLPQFYPTEENNLWWGKGFTEWTNVGKAKPLFKNHYQPRVPADLGYYDLRLRDVRQEQAELAMSAGIEGFCYWHYWFGNGRRVLDKVFKEVVETKEPNFPFCLAWANETWSGVWHGAKNKILMEQLYPGKADYEQHFYEVLPALLDIRYITVGGKPLFMVYKPEQIPNPKEFIDIWQNLAVKNGLKGIYFIGQTIYHDDIDKIIKQGFDACNVVRLYDYERAVKNKFQRGMTLLLNNMRVYSYKDAFPYFIGDEEKAENCLPTIIPNWDHSPRSGTKAYILHESTPALFREHLIQVFDTIKYKHNNNIAFIKSWNEWGEGNYLEPDLVNGRKYLEVLAEEMKKI
ncbi:MAG: glycoside hydrolase family 99-like domain-containing protein [Mucilaginibacter sp.]